jgi:hypothetical protein
LPRSVLDSLVDAEVSRSAMEMKILIEQMREQIQSGVMFYPLAQRRSKYTKR